MPRDIPRRPSPVNTIFSHLTIQNSQPKNVEINVDLSISYLDELPALSNDTDMLL